MAILTRFSRPFGNRSATSSNPITASLWELAILLTVWALLGIAYFFADYTHATKAKRYQLELASVTANVEKISLLAQVCGQDFMAKTASHRTDKDYKFAQDCTALTNGTQNPDQALQTANAQLNKIQQALAATWQQQKAKDRHTSLVENETEIQLGNDGLYSRKDWLDLNDNGQLDTITELQKQSQALLTAKTPISAENKTNLAIAMLAVADGNKRFGFSRLYAEQPDFAKLLNQTTGDVAGVYEANQNQVKAQQATQLLPIFGNVKQLGLMPQLFIWSIATWLMLTLSRQSLHTRHPLVIVPMAMTVWGLVIALVSHDVILPMKVGLALFCVGVLLTALSLFLPMQKINRVLPDNREQIASPWLFPLFVGFVVFGMMILLDLSSRSYLSLRYLFLAHFKDVFWGFVLVSVSRVIAEFVGLALQWLVANNLLHAMWSNVKSAKKKSYIWLAVMALGYLGLAVLFRHDSAKVAELGKMWLIAFLAVFLAINQRSLINNLLFKSKKMTLLLVFCLVLPVLALGIANEKGTILVMMFFMTFLVGVALSNKIFQMGGRGYILGVLSSTAILLALMMVLVNLSGFDDRTAERVSTWIDPFASTNDQMAILHWFRESTPVLGFGFGDIPWCGYHLSGCRGVPLQMQSDYTITSVMAVTGMGLGVVFIGLYMGWLVLMAGKQLAFANEQMKSRMLSGSYLLLSWLILVWVIVTIFQAIVTISGNLGMLPLTGVTLPFVSYGTSSLWFNCVMFGLALFQPKLVVNR